MAEERRKPGRRKGVKSRTVVDRPGEGLGPRKVPDVPAPPEPAESSARVAFVTRLMLAGLPLNQITEQAARSVGLDRKGTRAIYEKLCEAWARDVEQDLKHARAQAINRLRRDLAQIRAPGPMRAPHTGEVLTQARLDAFGQPVTVGGKTVRDPIPVEPNWQAVNAHERLLASIEGTLRPVEVAVDVNVTHRRSLAVLVASLSAEEIEQLEDEQRALEERAVVEHRG